MADQITSHRGTRLLVMVAALVVIIYGINQAQSVVVLLLLSIFFALIGTSPVLWLQRKRVPPVVAVIIVMAVMIVTLLIVGTVVGVSLSAFSEKLPDYQKRLEEQLLALKPLLASKQIEVTDKALLEHINPGPVMGLVVGLVTGMGLAVTNIILIVLMVTFILLEASSFRGKLRVVLGDPHKVFPEFTKFVGDMKRYMVIKTIVSLGTGIVIGTWLTFLGVDSPVLWGFLAFLLNYIPNIGSVIAAIPAVLVAFVQLGPGSAVMAGAGYIVVNSLLGNVIEPRIMGQRLGLSTLVVFVSLIIWGGLLGPVGMILCVPLTMTLKFACENNVDTQWIAVLLGPGKASESRAPVFTTKTGSET